MAFNAKKSAARITGNLGVSFFGPLVGGGVAESIFDVGLTFEQTLIIAIVASMFQTGLVISKEVQHYGYKK
jgi:hypothetical protein